MTLSSSLFEGTDIFMLISDTPLRLSSEMLNERTEVLKVLTMSIMRLMTELSWEHCILRVTWKDPLEGLSAHMTFWIR